MKKTILFAMLLYFLFMAVYLWTKYTLEDENQCGRCVRVCQAVCLDRAPCDFTGYVKTYFLAAFDGCRNIFK